MKQSEAFKQLHAFAEKHRALIVADIGSQSLWLKAAGDRPENLYLSGPMGMASSVALGVATAHKDRLVIAACGDGALGMNLTSLATISRAAPKNLIVMVLDNGIYEFTKGLPSPTQAVNWDQIPAAFPGFKTVRGLKDLNKLGKADGPHFVHAKIQPGPLPPGPGLNAIIVHERFKALLKDSAGKKTKQSC